MNKFNSNLKETDPIVYDLVEKERVHQNQSLYLIPSESFASKAVLQALGSVMNNKYSEGYPGRRYYEGNEFIDEVENLAIERAKKLFGAEHANVQPYSGSPANIEIYFGLLEFGDTIMGMSLDHGGHLTHGHKVNFSGKAFNVVQYGVEKETGLIDYDKVREIALEHKPKILISGATAYPRIIDFKKFHDIAKEAGAYSMADISHIAGLIAGKVHPSPFPFTDVVMTTTHKTLNGPRGAMILCREEIAKKIDRAVFPGMQGGPHNHAIAAKAVAFGEALQPDFPEHANMILKNAKALAESLMDSGIELVSGGTDNHLILADLTKTGVKGKEASVALDRAGIVLNCNSVPFDTRGPFDPSGIRMGTPAITSRGFKEDECKEIGALIAKVIFNCQDSAVTESVKKRVLELTALHPLYE